MIKVNLELCMDGTMYEKVVHIRWSYTDLCSPENLNHSFKNRTQRTGIFCCSIGVTCTSGDICAVYP